MTGEHCLTGEVPRGGAWNKQAIGGQELYLPIGKLAIIEPPEPSIVTPEMDAEYQTIVKEAERQFDAALPGFQAVAHGAERDLSDKGSEVIYIRRGHHADDELASWASLVARKMIALRFAIKDGNTESEIIGDFNPATDDLALTVTHDTEGRLPMPTGAIHLTAPERGAQLGIINEISTTWLEDPEAVMTSIGHGDVFTNPDAIEVVSVGTKPGYDIAGKILYNVVCVNNADKTAYYALYDEPAVKAINKSGNGFVWSGLPHINFHAHRRPGANRTSIYAMRPIEWQRNMNNHAFNSYWTTENGLLRSRYHLTYAGSYDGPAHPLPAR
jgi:hypothetical protein